MKLNIWFCGPTKQQEQGNINETTVHVFAGSNKTSNERSWKQNAETLLETRFAARPADITV